jgi:hypothetical protein
MNDSPAPDTLVRSRSSAQGWRGYESWHDVQEDAHGRALLGINHLVQEVPKTRDVDLRTQRYRSQLNLTWTFHHCLLIEASYSKFF